MVTKLKPWTWNGARCDTCDKDGIAGAVCGQAISRFSAQTWVDDHKNAETVYTLHATMNEAMQAAEERLHAAGYEIK